MLEKNGSAVDAALSSLICNGLLNMQSMGLGGGFLMTIYDKKKQKTVVLNARETAPLKTHEHMFDGESYEAIKSGCYLNLNFIFITLKDYVLNKNLI